MANFTRLMRYTFGAKTPEPKTPYNRSSTVKQEIPLMLLVRNLMGSMVAMFPKELLCPA